MMAFDGEKAILHPLSIYYHNGNRSDQQRNEMPVS